jgi:hypothetical protein
MNSNCGNKNHFQSSDQIFNNFIKLSLKNDAFFNLIEIIAFQKNIQHQNLV